MANDPTVWGVHMGAHVADRPIDGKYVGIGWDKIGDLTKIEATREPFNVSGPDQSHTAHGFDPLNDCRKRFVTCRIIAMESKAGSFRFVRLNCCFR